MRISAKVDYALRAAVELAGHYSGPEGVPVKADAIAEAQAIPVKFLENILQSLRQAGLVESRRGPDGGHRLAHDPTGVSLADVIRAIDGPLANVGSRSPDSLDFAGAAAPLREVWVALRVNVRAVLEAVTLAQVAQNQVPDAILALTRSEGAWQRR